MIEVKIVNNTTNKRKSHIVLRLLFIIHAPGFAHIFVAPRFRLVGFRMCPPRLSRSSWAGCAWSTIEAKIQLTTCEPV